MQKGEDIARVCVCVCGGDGGGGESPCFSVKVTAHHC